jgi:hypothetical protein
MSAATTEDGLHVITSDDEATDHDALAAEDGDLRLDGPTDGDLEDLRDAFVDGFNARDVEAILAIVHADVECPDMPAGDGAALLAEELEAIWERAPEAFLTRGLLDGLPVAVAWRPDEEGRWTRAALVCLVATDGLLSVVALPDDVDALERAETDDPPEAELEEWNDWSEWDRGEETVVPPHDRSRP